MGSLVVYGGVKVKAHHQHVFDSSSTFSCNYETGMSSQGERGKLSENKVSVIKQLNERLVCLEEEAQMIKQELYQTTEERNKLMNEIYQQFQAVGCCADRVTRHKPPQEGRKGPGLSQVLCQGDADLPSLIIRHLKAKSR